MYGCGCSLLNNPKITDVPAMRMVMDRSAGTLNAAILKKCGWHRGRPDMEVGKKRGIKILDSENPFIIFTSSESTRHARYEYAIKCLA